FADNFHTFSIEWNPSTIRWYIDGIQYHVLSITSEGLSEFHDDFFVLLNIAVGGLWPGNPDQTTVFPQTYEIDYVRVYKTVQQVEALEIDGQSSLPAKGSGRNFSIPGSPDWTYEWIVPDDAEILTGQGTENVEINWGCENGKIICNVTGNCDNYVFEKDIMIKNQIYANMFISAGEEDVLFYTDSLSESSLEWIVPPDALITQGQGTDSVWVDWGESFDNVGLVIDNSCGTNRLEYIPIMAGQYPFPALDKPHKIPGIIEAVNYDYGGEGVAYHDLSHWNEGPGPRQDEYVDTEYNDNGNPNVGWIRSGEWIEYSVSVDSASWYRLDMRVASANSSGGPFSVLFNDEEKLDGITVNGTGAWDSFRTINAGTLYLTPEDTIMTLNFEVGNFNLGKMTFTPGSDPSINLQNNKVENLLVYPTPAKDFLILQSELRLSELMILDMKGRIVYSEKLPGLSRVELDIEKMHSGIYLLKVFTTAGEVRQKLILKTK
ncbi:MAG: carbohydrate-binding protein, partial [Bacteroidales bacterium]